MEFLIKYWRDIMKWKLFFQIVALIIIAAVAFYIVYPKYETGGYRGANTYNKITGEELGGY